MKLKQWVVAASLAASGLAAWALPSVQDVEAAVKQGQYAQAETMMKEVVTAKPNSAKGHYLYAEILAHNARFAQAADEAKAAERLDPAIGFTQPEKFRAFQELLTREQRAESRPAPSTTRTSATTPAGDAAVAAREVAPQRSGGIPGWIWIVGLGAIGYAIWRGFSRSRAAGGVPAAGMGMGLQPGTGVMPNGSAPGYGQAPGYAPGGGYAPGAGGYPPGYAPQQANRGPGWVGTGLAAAGGVAAGMALDRMLRPGESGHAAAAGDGSSLSDMSHASSFDNGGFANNDAAQQLEDRSVDFGNGGDWGGDAGGSSSDDSGGSWD